MRARKSSQHEQTWDSLALPDELDSEILGELSALKSESLTESGVTKEEGEATEEEPEIFRKAPDPVRIYLKEMGSFPLLTREGEMEIAKRIENGQRALLSAVFNTPAAIREIIALGSDLRAGKVCVKEVTDDIDDDEISPSE